jgi:hypothetical protein
MGVKDIGGFNPTGMNVGGKQGASGRGSVYFGSKAPTTAPVTQTQSQSPTRSRGGGGSSTPIGDLTIKSAAYGRPRPIVYGRMRVGGNIIWADKDGIKLNAPTTPVKSTSPTIPNPPIPRLRTSAVSGAQGMRISSRNPTSAEGRTVYGATFAVAVCEGPISGILRIWAENKLIYDRRPGKPVTTAPGLNIRVYLGTETQEADPRIVAIDGAANTPAYRGTAYVVFYSMPLTEYGNKIPDLEFEVASFATTERLYEESVHISPSIAGDWEQRFTIDWERKYLLVADETSNVFNRVDLRTMETDYEASITGLGKSGLPALSIGFGFFTYTPDGGVIGSIGDPAASNSSPIVKFDPTTLRETGRIGAGGLGLGITPVTGPFRHNTAWAVNSAYDDVHRRDFALGRYAGSLDNSIMLLQCDTETPVYIWDTNNFENSMPAYSRCIAMCAGASPIGDGYCDFYVMFGPNYSGGASASNVGLFRLRVYLSAAYNFVGGQHVATGVEFTPLAVFTPGTMLAGETSLKLTGNGMTYDRNDDCLIWGTRGNTDTQVWHKFDPVLGTFTWTSDPVAELINNDGGQPSSFIQGGNFGYLVNASEGFLIDVKDGTILLNGTGDPWAVGPSGNGYGMYNDLEGAWYAINDADNKVYKFYMDGLNADSVSIQSIVEDLCKRAELNVSDYLATDLVSLTIPGYGIAGATTSRGGIEPLAGVYQFDGYESDWKLKFNRRGQAPVKTLIQEFDLSVTDTSTGDIFTETRQQEVELPYRYTLTYLDHTTDYLINSHSAQRPKTPDAAMYSNNRDEYEINAALDAQLAKRQAERILYSTWAERVNYSLRVSWKHIDLDPSDVVNFVTDAGVTYTGRINNQDVGDGYDLELSMSGERAEQYNSSVLADSGTGFREQAVDSIRYVFAKTLDIPYLYTSDAYEDNTIGHLYLFSAGLRADDFLSARWFRSADNVTFNPIVQAVDEHSWGRVLTALANPPNNNPYAIDEVNSIIVEFRAGEAPVTVTRLQMLNGANRMLLVKDNGEVELIHFQTVVANANGTFTLSNFMRGMRGTDTMCLGHTVNELFIMPDTGSLLTAPLAFNQDGVKQFFRTIGPQMLLQDGVRNEPTPIIRSLMPWKPSNIRATQSAGNIVFTWNRRDRLGNDMRDYTGQQPINEDSVSFTLRIYNASGGTLLRTVTGITAETYTYLAANITTDWGSMPATVWVQLEQVSGQVGAGFTREDKVDVE